MAYRRSFRRGEAYGITAALSPHFRLAGLALTAAAPLFLIAAFVPRTIFLPSVSLVAIAAAAVAAAAAWWLGARRHGPTVTLWDIAGACALIGCAAAMLSDPQAVLQPIGQSSEP